MKTVKSFHGILLLMALAMPALLAPQMARAVPDLMSYQGRLLDAQGQPITSNVTILFRFYDAATGGNQLPTWAPFSDQDALTPNANGYYDTIIGDPGTLEIPGSVFMKGSVWLSVTVDGEELLPRKQVTAVGYSMHSRSSEQIVREFPVLSGEDIEIGDPVLLTNSGEIFTFGGNNAPPGGVQLWDWSTQGHALILSADGLGANRVLICYEGNSGNVLGLWDYGSGQKVVVDEQVISGMDRVIGVLDDNRFFIRLQNSNQMALVDASSGSFVVGPASSGASLGAARICSVTPIDSSSGWATLIEPITDTSGNADKRLGLLPFTYSGSQISLGTVQDYGLVGDAGGFVIYNNFELRLQSNKTNGLIFLYDDYLGVLPVTLNGTSASYGALQSFTTGNAMSDYSKANIAIDNNGNFAISQGMDDNTVFTGNWTPSAVQDMAAVTTQNFRAGVPSRGELVLVTDNYSPVEVRESDLIYWTAQYNGTGLDQSPEAIYGKIPSGTDVYYEKTVEWPNGNWATIYWVVNQGYTIFPGGPSGYVEGSLLGISAEQGIGGDVVSVVVSGFSNLHSGLQVGKVYYVDFATGALTQDFGGYRLGLAVSPNELLLQIGGN